MQKTALRASKFLVVSATAPAVTRYTLTSADGHQRRIADSLRHLAGAAAQDKGGPGVGAHCREVRVVVGGLGTHHLPTADIFQGRN